MKTASMLATAAVFAAGAFFATSASASVVCNSDGDCWHTSHHYRYHPEFGITVHSDDWRWRDEDHDRYRWHEHRGRGYWRNGVWITF